MNVDFKNTSDFPGFQRLLMEGSLACRGAHVITFGCQQNEADSERVRGILESLGCKITPRAEEADIILLNTCAIREHAEMKALSMLGRFKALKRARPDMIIGILGCMAAEPSRVAMLKTDFHYVDFTLEPAMLHELPAALLSAAEKKRGFYLGTSEYTVVEEIPVKRTSPYKALVSVMYGCNNFCTYCIVPYVRGRERSRSSAAVIKECRELAESGVKEITLLGQNVNSYRSDMNFAELISEIAKIPGEFIIRFMTSHPKDVSAELISAIKNSDGKIAPYFHLPLQSGSNKILSLMNRTYTREKYIKTAAALREAVPEIALSTDIIIGFPGEDEDDFEETMKLLKEVRFDMLYAFLYSPRVGTKAAGMENRVERAVMDARMARLLAEQDKISYEKNQSFVGNALKVLIEAPSKRGGEDGVYTARAMDGRIVHISAEESDIGQFKTVEIERAGAACLFGSLK